MNRAGGSLNRSALIGIDGRPHFGIYRGPLTSLNLRPWHIESNDGLVRLRFLPAGKRSANTHAGLIVSKFHQSFGRFEGTLRDGDQVCELQNVAGFTEEHDAKW